MCGRTTLVTSVEEIAEIFGVSPTIPPQPPRYNIAPGQDMVVVRAALSSSPSSSRELALLHWGLVPWWTKGQEEAKRIAYRCINARSETAPTAPAFRDAFKARRCLVVVDGFYEWKTVPPAPTGRVTKGGRPIVGKPTKMPEHIRRPEGGVFTLAGLWDRWKSPEGEVVESCTILTTPSHGAIVSLHDRMPLIVAEADRDKWLTSLEGAGELLGAAEATQEARARELVIIPVSRRVNDVKNDDPSCLGPPEAETLPDQIGFAFRA